MPADWVVALPGELLVAVHAVFAPEHAGEVLEVAAQSLSRDALVGAAVAGDAATVFADFGIRESGFSRMLVYDDHMTPWQPGRIVQRCWRSIPTA